MYNTYGTRYLLLGQAADNVYRVPGTMFVSGTADGLLKTRGPHAQRRLRRWLFISFQIMPLGLHKGPHTIINIRAGNMSSIMNMARHASEPM